MEPVFYLENDENDFLLMDLAFRKVGCKKFVRWFTRSADFKMALTKSSPACLPNLTLIDLKLNGEYGLDVVQWLNKQEAFKSIPSFIISSGLISREITSTLDENASGYIFKPSNFEGWLELARQFKTMVSTPGARLELPARDIFAVGRV